METLRFVVKGRAYKITPLLHDDEEFISSEELLRRIEQAGGFTLDNSDRELLLSDQGDIPGDAQDFFLLGWNPKRECELPGLSYDEEDEEEWHDSSTDLQHMPRGFNGLHALLCKE